EGTCFGGSSARVGSSPWRFGGVHAGDRRGGPTQFCRGTASETGAVDQCFARPLDRKGGGTRYFRSDADARASSNGAEVAAAVLIRRFANNEHKKRLAPLAPARERGWG